MTKKKGGRNRGNRGGAPTQPNPEVAASTEKPKHALKLLDNDIDLLDKLTAGNMRSPLSIAPIPAKKKVEEKQANKNTKEEIVSNYINGSSDVAVDVPPQKEKQEEEKKDEEKVFSTPTDDDTAKTTVPPIKKKRVLPAPPVYYDSAPGSSSSSKDGTPAEGDASKDSKTKGKKKRVLLSPEEIAAKKLEQQKEQQEPEQEGLCRKDVAKPFGRRAPISEPNPAPKPAKEPTEGTTEEEESSTKPEEDDKQKQEKEKKETREELQKRLKKDIASKNMRRLGPNVIDRLEAAGKRKDKKYAPTPEEIKKKKKEKKETKAQERKQKKQIRHIINTKGLTAALQAAGNNDSGIHAIFENAVKTGKIDNPPAMSEELSAYLDNQKSS